jgi:hypothetical protein
MTSERLMRMAASKCPIVEARNAVTPPAVTVRGQPLMV